MVDFLGGAVLVVATTAIIIVLVLTARRRRHEPNRGPGMTETDAAAPQPAAGRPCPLCGTTLARGERVHSVIRLSSSGERIMEISGCPHCRPPATQRRTCPVCRAELRPGDVLTALVYDRSKTSAKPHVHVLGCTRCRG